MLFDLIMVALNLSCLVLLVVLIVAVVYLIFNH
jgi:hypothetical protein